MLIFVEFLYNGLLIFFEKKKTKINETIIIDSQENLKKKNCNIGK